MKIDVVSNFLKHHSLMSKQMMRHLLEQPFVRDMITPSITTINMWSDNGGHFHSNIFSYWSMVELLGKIPTLHHVRHNFFVEYHGKNACDGHFANIQYWMDSYSLSWPKGINNTPEVMKSISEGTQTAAPHKHHPKAHGPLNVHDESQPVSMERDTSTHPINFDVEQLPDHIQLPLTDPMRMECALEIPAVKCMTH